MAGRPKKPEGKVRSKLVPVRLSEGEYELLDRAAKAKSLQLSSWIRSEMLALARRLLSKEPKE
jgi:hypothetical protein